MSWWPWTPPKQPPPDGLAAAEAAIALLAGRVTTLEQIAAKRASEALELSTLLEKLQHWASGEAARQARRTRRELARATPGEEDQLEIEDQDDLALIRAKFGGRA